MKRSALFLATLAAACGPKATTTTGPGNTGGGGSGGGAGGEAAALWAGVMKPGAIFSFNDRLMEDGTPEEFTTVEGTVVDVRDIEGGKVALIHWTVDGEEMSGGLPGAIFVTTAGVRFETTLEANTNNLVWPASVAASSSSREDYALYIEDRPGGEKCYGEGPLANADECEDVCFAELCVKPDHGLMGGGGTWWPNYTVYQRRDFTK